MRRVLLALSLLIHTAACSAIPNPFLPPTVSLLSPSPIPWGALPLSIEALQNATYSLPGFGDAIHACPLENGICMVDDPLFGRIEVTLIEPVAFGDLNGDGVGDAAVLLAANAGRSGIFVSLHAVLNEAGQPRPSASSRIDDRPRIHQLAIEDGAIVLEATLHDSDDPACCPEWSVRRTFRLVGLSLMMVQASTSLPDGRQRRIVIQSPQPGEQVGEAVSLNGQVTMAPPGNALAYRVYNREGKEWSAGSLRVESPQPGVPGTFSAWLPADTLPYGRLRLVVLDLNPADGSILALDSVEIVR